jgi:hypothetical protein
LLAARRKHRLASGGVTRWLKHIGMELLPPPALAIRSLRTPHCPSLTPTCPPLCLTAFREHRLASEGVTSYGWLERVSVELLPQPALATCSLPTQAASQLGWREFGSEQQHQHQQQQLLASRFTGVLTVSHS